MNRSLLARLLTRLALHRPLVVIAVAVAIAVAGGVLASRLALQTDLSELLPAEAPSVRALHKLSARVGGTGNVAIAIESVDGKPAALRAYVPLLVDTLRAQLGADLMSIKYTRKDVTDYFDKYAAYYVPLDQLEAWSKRLSVALAKQNPAYVELDDTAEQPLRALVEELRAQRAKLEPKNAADPQTGLLMSEHGRLAVVFVRPASSSLDLAGAGGMLDRIDDIVQSTRPGDHGVRIAGYTGSIPVALTEVAAIRSDIVSTALLVMLGVGAVIMLYFRGIRELLLTSSAVVVGTAVALGFAKLWIGHVNAQTAFLGAIIVGTGINYGIILLDRYRQARVAIDSFEDALEQAIGQTLRATAIAAISTAISFGVLAAGEVESFHQFGWIGGIGILACWLATFTIVPAFIAVVDRHRRPRPLPGFRPVADAFEAIARGCQRWPRLVTLIALGLVVVSVTIAVHAENHVVETDLRALGTRSSDESGIQRLDQRLRAMDDRSATPAVIATDSRAETRQVCDILNQRARTDLKGIIVRCYSIENLFPHDLEHRIPLIQKLRHDLDAVDDDEVDAGDRADLADLRRALREHSPTDADLPPTLSEYFIERDGSVGKLAYVEPHAEDVEDNLYKFTDAIRSIRLPSGKVIESSGDLVVFADVLRAMRRDATKLTIAAAVLVLLVLAIVTRRRGSFVRVGAALVAGIVVMCGTAVLLGQKLNFFNFVALPTTFGIGIDYAINIEERIRQRGRAAMASALAETGPPVVLASVTSMIGYASLLIADSRALVSFGALAIIGELTCVLLAIIFVPALWAFAAKSPMR